MSVRAARKLWRIGVVFVTIAIVSSGLYAQASGESSHTPKPIPAVPTIIKEPRIILPVCNCEESVVTDEPIIIRLRWGATTRELAENGADNVVYTVTVDGKPIDELDRYRKLSIFAPGSVDGDDAWWVYWDYPLGTLPSGDHTIKAFFVASSTIWDGWQTYPEGDSATLQVILHVVEPPTPGVVYLSELHPQSTTVGWGTFSIGRYEFTSSDPADKINQGDPIVVHNVVYRHGLYAHAPSRLAYNLYGDFAELESTIGLVDWNECGDGVSFTILLDGEEIYRSPIMLASSIPIKVNVSVTGGHELLLIVDPIASKHCDWAIWGDPTLR